MGKVTKILLKVLSVIGLSLIILPVTLSLLLSMPSIQNFAVDRAAEFASEALDTKVSIDKITIGFPTKLRVRGFYVEDLDRDTLIYADVVTAHIGGFGANRLTLNYGRIEGGKFVLRETERGPMNIKEITDRLVRKDRKKKSPFKLQVRTLDVDSIDFRLERLVFRNPEYGVDYTNMRIYDIVSRLEDFYVDGGAVGGRIKRLSMYEHCGFVLDDLTAESLHIENGHILFSSLHFCGGSSDVYLPELQLRGEGWRSYKDFINNVRMDVVVEHSSVDSYDAGFFAPALSRWDTSVSDASVSMHGTVADFRASIDHATLADGGVLAAKGTVKGLINVPATRFNIDIGKFSASGDQTVHLLRNIARLDIPASLVTYAERAERLSLHGEFNGTLSNFSVDATVGVGSGGELDVEGTMHTSRGVRHIVASVDGASVAVGRLLGKRIFGDATFSVTADARLGGSSQRTVAASGTVASFGFNDYDYSDISFSAGMEGDDAEISVLSGDRSLDFDLKSLVNIGDNPGFSAEMNLRKADLAAMKVNRRDSVSVLSAQLAVEVSGSSLDNADGEASIAEATYRYNDRRVDYDRVRLSVDVNEDTRKITLSSDFADVVFESRSPYEDVIYYAKNLLNRYIPTLYTSEKRDEIMTRSENLRENVALLSVTTKRLDPLLGCLVPGLEVSEGSKAEIFINPTDNWFAMRANSGYISKGNYLITELDLDVDNRQDSLTMRLSAADTYISSIHLSTLGLNGGVKDNRLQLAARFADTVRHARGEVAMRALVSRRDSVRHVAVDMLPSYVMQGNKIWNITSDGVNIESSRIDINKFVVRSDDQRLSVDGVVSRSLSDEVSMELSNFSLAPFVQVAHRLGYDIDGRTNGYAKVRSALKDTQISANIGIDEIRVNSLRMPDLTLTSDWDFGRSRASLTVETTESKRQIIRGFFSPSDVRYYARARIPKLDMALLDPMLKGVISGTAGEGDVDLELTGRRRDAEIKGRVGVKDLSTMVDYTKCRYRIPKAEMVVAGNKFVVEDAPMFDESGRRGLFDLTLDMNHLSNIEYDVNIDVSDMEVLNTDKQDNDMFYGKVYASGNATIRGDKSGVVMDFEASTSDDSKFFMPLSGKSNISDADFVSFKAADLPDTTDYLVRKKLSFERRNQRRAATSGVMDINMTLEVRPNAEVQLVIDPTVGDIIKGRGEGTLSLRINPRHNIFEMYGDYTIEEGSYLFTLQNIINKRFVINTGSTIQWTGDPLDAMLNIDAVYKLKASLSPLLEGSLSQSSISSRAVPVECVIHLTDRLTQPTVNFDVVVPNADAEAQTVIANALSTPESRSQQFLYLLVANSFMSESAGESSPSLLSSSTAAATGFELLSNQLSNWLSTDDFNITIRYRPRTEQMSDEVDFGFSKGLIDNRLLIELEGNYIVDKSQVVNANSNFAGEAYVTWLIDRAGTLRLKGFTHTIDRFDENQGLQETGIGIYYKEDFDNFADLRRRVATRFARKNRVLDGDDGKATSRRGASQNAGPESDRREYGDVESDPRDYDERW